MHAHTLANTILQIPFFFCLWFVDKESGQIMRHEESRQKIHEKEEPKRFK